MVTLSERVATNRGCTSSCRSLISLLCSRSLVASMATVDNARPANACFDVTENYAPEPALTCLRLPLIPVPRVSEFFTRFGVIPCINHEETPYPTFELYVDALFHRSHVVLTTKVPLHYARFDCRLIVLKEFFFVHRNQLKLAPTSSLQASSKYLTLWEASTNILLKLNLTTLIMRIYVQALAALTAALLASAIACPFGAAAEAGLLMMRI